MRQLTGVGTPRSLQGRAAAVCTALIGLLVERWERVRPSWAVTLPNPYVSAARKPASGLDTKLAETKKRPVGRPTITAELQRTRVITVRLTAARRPLT